MLYKASNLGNSRRELLWKLTTISDISAHVTSVEELRHDYQGYINLHKF